ncbi:MAG: autotransporter-associated beta strand repeat-containing protein, partial [Chthoniobacter sp.]|nr:autotransporter-associated beta strand repeat-containing protein [Chthoniobacter sp.]
MKTTTNRIPSILATSIAALLAAHSAHAASSAWNVNANGDWITGGNWTAGTPGATGDLVNPDIATFNFLLTTVPKVVTVDANRGIGGISFGQVAAGGNNGNFGYTLTGGNLLLNNAGVIQTLTSDGAHMEVIASAIQIQGDGGAASFTGDATNGSNLMNIGAVTGVSTGVNITTLNLNGVNTGGNVITGIVGDGSGGGKLAITKSAAGTWFLDGANTYTGATTINAGTLVADHASALGIGGNITFGGGTLQYTATSAGADWGARFKNTVGTGILLNTAGHNVTLAGGIDASNVAGLTKSGGGTLTLSGANLYTGATIIGGNLLSILRLNNASALGGGGNITFSGGRLQHTANNTVDYSSRFVGSGSAIAIDTNGQNISFASAVAATNTGGLNKIGTGDLTFGGNISHLYTGTTSVSGGRLILDNTGVGNNNTNRITDGSGLTLNTGTFLYKGADDAATNSTETMAAINVSTGTLTVAFGGTNAATLTGSSLNNANKGSTLVNGLNLGMDNTSTASVARLKITGAPSLTGTTNALDAGINAAAQDTKIVPFLVGEATATTGGLGTATGVANTFVTWNANTGLRPLNPTDEFSNNSILAAKNNRVTSATTVSSTAAINSLIVHGADLTIASGQTLTNNSGAILFASSNTIKTVGGVSGFLFGAASEYLVTVNAGVNATISSGFTNTVDTGHGINMSGAGTLNLRGNSVFNVDSNTNTQSRVTVEGGGTLNINGVIMAFATAASNRGTGTSLVGQTSSGNTLLVSETGRLRAGGMTIGGDIYGNNTVIISAPGNAASQSWHLNGNGAQINLGVSSSNNTLTFSNGAYLRQDQGGGTNGWTIGTNAGANNNSIVVTGIGSTVNRGGAAGSFINLGGAGNGNSLIVSGGGWVLPRRTAIAISGGSNNYIQVTGYRSLFSSSGDAANSRIQIANSVGAQGNYLSIEAGATGDWTSSNNAPFAIGTLSSADNNFLHVTGKDSLLTVLSATPLTFGGTRTSLAAPVDSNAKGNHLDVSNRATLVTNSVELMGVQSAFNIGNGSGVSRATVGQSTLEAFTPGIFLRSADASVNFNGGRLFAGAGGALISGLGTVVLNGPAFISTTQTNSAISSVIANGTANSLTKEGSGSLFLSAANTYTGTTSVNAGTLVLDYTVAGGKLADASTVTLGGGTLDLRNGATTEIIAGVSLGGGRSKITQTAGTSILRANAITPGVGIVDVFLANTVSSTNTNDASDGGGIIGAWATLGGVDWAINSGVAEGGGNNYLTAYTAYTSYDALGSTLADVAINNARLDTAAGSGNISLAAATTTINTLLQSNVTGAATVDTVGSTLATNGIMIATGTDAVTIGVAAGDGSLRTATAGANLVLNNNNTSGLVTLTINAPIVANGSSGLATAGLVSLNGTNTYTGNTGIGGTLSIDGAGQLGGGTYAGTIAMSSSGRLVLNSSANNTLSGIISGDGGLTQSGAGTTTLSGANTYTGSTIVNAGILVANHATALGSPTTASLIFGSGSTGEVRLNGNNITVTGLNTTGFLGTPTVSNGAAGAATLTLDTGRTSTGVLTDSTFGGVLQNGGAGSLAIVKNGQAGLTLTGASTYTGGTMVNSGSLTLSNQNGLGTGTLTLAEGTLFQTASFEGNTAAGAIPNVINLSGGQVFFNIPFGQKDIWLDQDVSGPGAMRLLSDLSGRTLTLSGAKSFSGGIIQTSGSLANNGTGNNQHPSVQIDNVLSLGAGTFRAQVNSTSISGGALIVNADLSAGVANAFEIAASSRLLINETSSTNHLKLSGIISGNGDLNHVGPATLTLSGTNTYTGSTILTTGVVSVGAEANLGGANLVNFNGGTLQVTGTTLNNFGIHAPVFTATKAATFDIVAAANTFTVSQVLNQTTG